jgi:uncharacterized protein (TIGR00299 family) protein
MALGSLLDAGADVGEVRSLLSGLPFSGWELDTEPVLRGGVAATHAIVHATEAGVVRTHSHIVGLINEARLPDRVRDRSLAAFDALAVVEGRLHRRPPAQVHFHELGGIDAIVDIVGTCAALEVLGVDAVWASPVATGTGMVRTAHGVLPNPAPAVVGLLEGAPTYGRDLAVELTTPTGAALLATLCEGWGPMPPMHVAATGYGAGSREIEALPNMVQVVIGARQDRLADPLTATGHPVVLLEANVDDATGEVLAHTLAALIEAGAHDAWITSVVGKKGRPAHVVSAVSDPALVGQLVTVLSSETGTLGVRGQSLTRWPASRHIREVEVDGYPVRVKISPGRVKAEYEDAARVARRLGVPLREVTIRAESEARRRPAAIDEASESDDPTTAVVSTIAD